MMLQGPDGDRITDLLLRRMAPGRGYTFRAIKSLVGDMNGTQKPTTSQLRALLSSRKRDFVYHAHNRRWSRRQDLRIVYNSRTRHYEVIDETDNDRQQEAALVTSMHEQDLLTLLMRAASRDLP